jgi:hypothetical protein
LWLSLLSVWRCLVRGQNLKISDLDQVRLSCAVRVTTLDNDFVIRNYSTSSDVLVIMVKTAAGCSAADPVGHG